MARHDRFGRLGCPQWQAAGEGALDYRVVAAALAPVLLAQGILVRRRAPRLPEPPGPRAGTAGSGPALRLLIAGDSAAAGVGAPHQSAGLAGAMVATLEPHFRISWRLLARTGLRTRQLIARLEAAPAETFDVALLSLGVNDVTGGTRTAAFRERQRRLATLLQTRFGIRHVLLTGLPPMHVFPALPQPLRWVLGQRALCFTAALADLAAADSACELVLPALPLDLAYMAADGFHPGPLAYDLWAREAAAIIRRRLAAERSA